MDEHKKWDAHLGIAGFALLVLLASFVFDCVHQSRLPAPDSRVIADRPLLHIRGIARIDACMLGVSLDSAEPLARPVGALPVAELYTTICVVNTGNAMARVASAAATDTALGGPRLRQLLLSKESRESQVSWQDWARYYDLPDILPGDSTLLSFTHRVQLPVGGDFTLHYLVIYKNELGDLYDTHHWLRGHVDSVAWASSLQSVPGSQSTTKQLQVISSTRELLRAIEFTEPNEAYYVYRQEDARAIEDWARRNALQVTSRRRSRTPRRRRTGTFHRTPEAERERIFGRSSGGLP